MFYECKISFYSRDCAKEGQVYVWQGYTGKVELISFTTFLTRPVRCVTLGEEHSLILTYDDSLFSCGSNEHGQLGVPACGRDYSFDPVLIKSLSGELKYTFSYFFIVWSKESLLFSGKYGRKMNVVLVLLHLDAMAGRNVSCLSCFHILTKYWQGVQTSINPFPHTTILQQTTLNVFCQNIENLYN